MDPFQSKLETALRELQVLRRGQSLLAALSGGPDSVAMLHAVAAFAGEHGLQVSAAHVNHSLRGADSREDQSFVERFCARLGVPLAVRVQDTRRMAEQTGANLEDCARSFRYSFLVEEASRTGGVVLTAHTLNDQAETFLMKLVRGAGPAGLSGIYPRHANPVESPRGMETGWVLRPMLEVTRSEVLEYLDRFSQEYRKDLSNEDISLDRNWVRHELLPAIAARLNPAVAGTLGRTAGLFQEIESYLREEGAKALGNCREEGGDAMALRLAVIAGLHPALRRELVRQAIREVRGTLDGISQRHVQDVLALASGTSGRECHLPGALTVRREYERLVFLTAAEAPPFCYEVNVPGEIRVSEAGKRVIVRRAGAADRGPGDVVLRDIGTSPIVVRNRRPGDRLQLAPATPPRRLKKLLQEKRIPRSRRESLLVFEQDGEILWVEGFPVPPALRPLGEEEAIVEILVIPETLL
jgi:tRNA(Ile)-lysidine synthase